MRNSMDPLQQRSSRERPPSGLQFWDPYKTGTLAPARPLFVVGDVHGCYPLLYRLMHRLLPRARRRNAEIVLVGDYIDRGPESRKTLEYLRDLVLEGHPITCLAGNHEAMLLDFLEDPARTYEWLDFGGRETLKSYGLEPPGFGRDALLRTADDLRKAIGPKILNFLGDLPIYARSGNVFIAHAGTDPGTALAWQNKDTLLWGQGSKPAARDCGTWVVQGHVIQKAPKLSTQHIAIDTGAYATGRLTAAEISDGRVAFLTA